jgi:glycosyltransferase involved in cell wall biosynthesis
VPQLIEAMRSLDDVPLELRIVGGTGDEGEAAAAAMQAAAADLFAQGRIHFLGSLAPDDVRSEVERSHLLVLPSQSEGMPMAMLEAMAAGRAVVVSPAGNMGDVVREARCGVVLDSAAPEAIAAALRGAAGDLDRLRDWGLHAHDAVVASYSEVSIRVLLTSLLG